MSSVIFKAWDFLFGRFLGKLIGIILGGSVLFILYLLISRIVSYNSDDASIILEGQAVMRGNLIMRGWYVPADNFLTIDIPLYALGLLLGFSKSSLLQIIPSLLYTLVVIAGGYLASTLLQGRQRVWSVLAFLAIVAFPSFYMVRNILIGPIHVGTILFILLGLIAYRFYYLKENKRKKLAFAGILLMTVLMIVGDPFALVLFLLPILFTEVLQRLAKKRLAWRENPMLLGILLAALLGFSIRQILEFAGLHLLLSAGFVLASPANMGGNFIDGIKGILLIFHANILSGNSFSLENIAIVINLLVVIALVYAMARWSIRYLFSTTTAEAQVVSVLIWGSIGVFTAFTLSTLGGSEGVRYLYPLLFFGGVICFAITHAFIHRYVLKFAIILALLANITIFAVNLFQAPNATQADIPLITLLKEHHWTQGLGAYWASTIVTVQSEEQIVVRPVIRCGNHVYPQYFLSDEKWYNEANLQQANFIVYRYTDKPQAFYEASVQSFGMPDYQYNAGIYTVLAWNTPLITHMQAGYSFWISYDRSVWLANNVCYNNS